MHDLQPLTGRPRCEPWFHERVLPRDTYVDVDYVRAAVVLASKGNATLDVSWMALAQSKYALETVPVQHDAERAVVLTTPIADPDTFWVLAASAVMWQVPVDCVTEIHLRPFIEPDGPVQVPG